MRRYAVCFVIAGCLGGEPKESGESQSSDDSSGSGGPCGESGICALETSEALVDCGDGTVALAAVSNAPGELTVNHGAFSQGCCPNFAVTGEASQRRSEIAVTYALTEDVCDCICMLDLQYTLTGIPAGNWTLLTPDSQSQPVTVQ